MKTLSLGLLLSILASGLLAAAPGSVSAQQPNERTRLQVLGPPAVSLGSTSRMVALLQDAEARPIPDATIVFSSPASFGGTISEMELAAVVTNAEGIAILDYPMRAEGQNQFIARYYGDHNYRPAEAATVVVATGSEQLVQRTAGVRVPLLGSWALLAVLLGVWSVYLAVMLLVSQIPEATAHKTEG